MHRYYSEKDCLRHYVAYLGDYIFDIFSGSKDHLFYLCPPDADVNILCYDNKGYDIWFPVEKKKYSINMDLQSIIERILQKKAFFFFSEWEEKDYERVGQRLRKLAEKGWKIEVV